ncbi:hypothetical protein ACFX13_045750 [Malus domestica]|uniref:NHL domain protein n=1 Tax=Malus domestica TaxID=3750 RepID=A0A498J6H9_MALDO|nr:uncharacterized protein LOC114826899 [Malus domestica]XP_050103944.1 uncharacterized protein LOC126583562 [Malus sylvestris]RXH89442.1 hypothetical protein DVH24_031799 [Malus domestica]
MASKIAYDAVPNPKTDSAAESDDGEELMLARRSGCCFWIPCFGSEPSSPDGSWERIRSTGDYEGLWWNRGWKKIREWSELLAGPKWKTFIRRFNKNNPRRSVKFQYDPMSYALNFDEGPGQNGNLSDDYLYKDFSCRYASIPASAKSSMDLSNDSPSLT